VKVEAVTERVAMARPVAVSRGAYPEHDIVVVTVSDGAHVGRGECCAIAHFGLSAEKTMSEIAAASQWIGPKTTRADLLALMPAGPARNGLDCALWDLESTRTGRSVWELAGLAMPARASTAVTILLASPEDMAAQARSRAGFSTLKLKLGQGDPEGCVRAVRAARPDAKLTIDANEAWSAQSLASLTPVFLEIGVAFVEQPCPASDDATLPTGQRALPLCADESFHTIDDLARVALHFDWINIKLDKCGGLTAALEIIAAAPSYGLNSMVGCMFATSLAVAPAMVAASRCALADLDGPLHLATDREDAFHCADGAYIVDSTAIWGRGDRQSGGA
jgi:L-Ala-D/L-Glu epimerase